jgi:chalcone synthase
MIDKRHVYVSDEMLKSNPCITAYKSPSLNLRQALADATVPQLGAEAARDAISDWGRPASDITHLVFCTTVSGCMPGADFEIVKLLSLPLSTRRVMLYQAGCHGGGIALRLAKDLAENNPGARVLVVCSEVITMALRGPSEAHMGNLVGQAIFGDAAGAAVVGAGGPTFAADERPVFELLWASQDIVPGTEEAVVSKLHEEGIVYTLHRDVALHISSSIEPLVTRALEQTGGEKLDWNEEVFWVVHPGGREILDRVERRLGLRREKLEVSREVMRNHGNTLSSCVIIAMAEMRRRSAEQRQATAGEGLHWGLLFGFGPGLTVETILLRALPMNLPSFTK